MRTFNILTLVGILFILVFNMNVFAADLRDYGVVIVEANTHEQTKDLYSELADYFIKQNMDDKAANFRALVRGQAFGSGFVYVDENNKEWVVTNRHVVEQAQSVNIVCENREKGSKTSFPDCEIVYVSYDYDVAIIKLPDGERKFQKVVGLELDPQPIQTKVWAAGFPALGRTPSYQITNGIITNDKTLLPDAPKGSTGYAIQHNAAIDPGSSGGPLLIEDKAADAGYKLIGINTYNARNRQNTNFAIPISFVNITIGEAKKMVKDCSDIAAMQKKLEEACRIFADELNSEHPNPETLMKYISYDFVANQGFSSYLQISQLTELNEFTKDFNDYPISTMRNCLFLHMLRSEQNHNIAYMRINQGDLTSFNIKKPIRTLFSRNGVQREVSWIFEYGYWRISTINLFEDNSSQPVLVQKERITSSVPEQIKINIQVYDSVRHYSHFELVVNAPFGGRISQKSAFASGFQAGLQWRGANGAAIGATAGFSHARGTGFASSIIGDIPINDMVTIEGDAGFEHLNNTEPYMIVGNIEDLTTTTNSFKFGVGVQLTKTFGILGANATIKAGPHVSFVNSGKPVYAIGSPLEDIPKSEIEPAAKSVEIAAKTTFDIDL